jgi:hypothetical protein
VLTRRRARHNRFCAISKRRRRFATVYIAVFSTLTDAYILPALDFREWLGGEEEINAHCHALALDGGARMAEILGTELMAHSDEIALNMVHIICTSLPPHN